LVHLGTQNPSERDRAYKGKYANVGKNPKAGAKRKEERLGDRLSAPWLTANAHRKRELASNWVTVAT